VQRACNRMLHALPLITGIALGFELTQLQAEMALGLR